MAVKMERQNHDDKTISLDQITGRYYSLKFFRIL
jgi:hypothetical protein